MPASEQKNRKYGVNNPPLTGAAGPVKKGALGERFLVLRTGSFSVCNQAVGSTRGPTRRNFSGGWGRAFETACG